MSRASTHEGQERVRSSLGVEDERKGEQRDEEGQSRIGERGESWGTLDVGRGEGRGLDVKDSLNEFLAILKAFLTGVYR